MGKINRPNATVAGETMPCEESKMSLNCDDQLWIKRLFDRQDDALADMFAEQKQELDDRNSVYVREITDGVFAKVAEVLKDSNEKMLAMLNQQNECIANIQSDVSSIKKQMDTMATDMDGVKSRLKTGDDRMDKFEKYMSWQNTAVRIALAVAIAVIASITIHHFFA